MYKRLYYYETLLVACRHTVRVTRENPPERVGFDIFYYACTFFSFFLLTFIINCRTQGDPKTRVDKGPDLCVLKGHGTSIEIRQGARVYPVVNHLLVFPWCPQTLVFINFFR